MTRDDAPKGTRRITGEEAAHMLLGGQTLRWLESVYRGTVRTSGPVDWSQVIQSKEKP
jgi:hypothetical protein